MEGTTFRPVIGDTLQRADNGSVRRVIMCAGQVYYDLAKARDERGLGDDVAIVRVEQLYPFPYAEAEAELAKFPNAAEILWAQEEPKNQGAWYQTRHRLETLAKNGQKVSYAGRPASASPAVGYASKHNAQLKQLLEDALNLDGLAAHQAVPVAPVAEAQPQIREISPAAEAGRSRPAANACRSRAASRTRTASGGAARNGCRTRACARARAGGNRAGSGSAPNRRTRRQLCPSGGNDGRNARVRARRRAADGGDYRRTRRRFRQSEKQFFRW
uniref:2-oxoglutarate dehydrogenase E1 component/KDG C-terminal domain-containing protein n=1 Tax=Conchiformibius kuhniae TaxID=211502 RepID=A0A8T9N196_9NEIS|nr:hypothetical protein LVJ77_02125 [Conchiformibius kuhniae]